MSLSFDHTHVFKAESPFTASGPEGSVCEILSREVFRSLVTQRALCQNRDNIQEGATSESVQASLTDKVDNVALQRTLDSKQTFDDKPSFSSVTDLSSLSHELETKSPSELLEAIESFPSNRSLTVAEVSALALATARMDANKHPDLQKKLADLLDRTDRRVALTGIFQAIEIAAANPGKQPRKLLSELYLSRIYQEDGSPVCQHMDSFLKWGVQFGDENSIRVMAALAAEHKYIEDPFRGSQKDDTRNSNRHLEKNRTAFDEFLYERSNPSYDFTRDRARRALSEIAANPNYRKTVARALRETGEPVVDELERRYQSSDPVIVRRLANLHDYMAQMYSKCDSIKDKARHNQEAEEIRRVAALVKPVGSVNDIARLPFELLERLPEKMQIKLEDKMIKVDAGQSGFLKILESIPGLRLPLTARQGMTGLGELCLKDNTVTIQGKSKIEVLGKDLGMPGYDFMDINLSDVKFDFKVENGTLILHDFKNLKVSAEVGKAIEKVSESLEDNHPVASTVLKFGAKIAKAALPKNGRVDACDLLEQVVISIDTSQPDEPVLIVTPTFSKIIQGTEKPTERRIPIAKEHQKQLAALISELEKPSAQRQLTRLTSDLVKEENQELGRILGEVESISRDGNKLQAVFSKAPKELDFGVAKLSLDKELTLTLESFRRVGGPESAEKILRVNIEKGASAKLALPEVLFNALKINESVQVKAIEFGESDRQGNRRITIFTDSDLQSVSVEVDQNFQLRRFGDKLSFDTTIHTAERGDTQVRLTFDTKRSDEDGQPNYEIQVLNNSLAFRSLVEKLLPGDFGPAAQLLDGIKSIRKEGFNYVVKREKATDFTVKDFQIHAGETIKFRLRNKGGRSDLMIDGEGCSVSLPAVPDNLRDLLPISGEKLPLKYLGIYHNADKNITGIQLSCSKLVSYISGELRDGHPIPEAPFHVLLSDPDNSKNCHLFKIPLNADWSPNMPGEERALKFFELQRWIHTWNRGSWKSGAAGYYGPLAIYSHELSDWLFGK